MCSHLSTMTSIKISNTIEFTTYFVQQLRAAPTEIKEAFKDALQLLQADPHHESLRNHQLRGRFAGQRSIDITPDWRAIFTKVSTPQGVLYRFRHLGTHAQLYS